MRASLGKSVVVLERKVARIKMRRDVKITNFERPGFGGIQKEGRFLHSNYGWPYELARYIDESSKCSEEPACSNVESSFLLLLGLVQNNARLFRFSKRIRGYRYVMSELTCMFTRVYAVIVVASPAPGDDDVVGDTADLDEIFAR